VTNIGVTLQASSKTSKKVEHAFTIIGTARGSPQKTASVWTLEENIGCSFELKIQGKLPKPDPASILQLNIAFILLK
jgi:hypothetical protein